MVPAKEAKELLYNLLSEKFINLQVKILPLFHICDIGILYVTFAVKNMPYRRERNCMKTFHDFLRAWTPSWLLFSRRPND
jgi:hypothetical protein